MKMVVLLSALAGSASAVFAQGTPLAYPLESEIRFEVWNGTSWGSTVSASPGQQVEYRVVMNYTGPRTDLIGLGDSRYQPTFSNADNVGASKDTLVAFPGDGSSTYTQNMLTAAQGASGNALPSYGRVTYGVFTHNLSNLNRLRNFRHGGDSTQAGAPSGQWLRVAGEFVGNWPAASLPSNSNPADTNAMLRGVSAGQFAPVRTPTNQINTNFVSGVSNLVVFRHAIVLSDSVDARTLTISTEQSMLVRDTSFGADDRRYIQWHVAEQNVVLGTYRTSVAIVPAFISVPTPGVFGLACAFSIAAGRRRR